MFSWWESACALVNVAPRHEEFFMATSGHVPVMPEEVKAWLPVMPGMTVVDATLGLGGHARSFVDSLGPKGRLIGLDRDPRALEEAERVLEGKTCALHLVHDDFRHIDNVLSRLKIDGVDVFLFDLGVSSIQLDDPERGFSFRAAGPLDMRMDPNGFITAYDLVNTLTEEEISSILWKFGEERFSRRIARAIVSARVKAPLATTEELADLVRRAVPGGAREGRIHPATRTFQALRIAVNRELESLEEALQKAALFLNVGGRIGVIAFHSLEDRIVKESFRALAATHRFERCFKKIVRPSDAEVAVNPRARSARLRVIERIA
jgi:16S rRNA (cytosine1402-N4)-methyltransferase